MKRVLLIALSVPLLSIAAYGQTHPRVNYYQYEMTASPLKNVVQFTTNVTVVVSWCDDDTFQKYKDGQQVSPQLRVEVQANPKNPSYLFPPADKHWHLVIDRNGAAFPNGTAFRLVLYSDANVLSPKTS